MSKTLNENIEKKNKIILSKFNKDDKDSNLQISKINSEISNDHLGNLNALGFMDNNLNVTDDLNQTLRNQNQSSFSMKESLDLKEISSCILKTDLDKLNSKINSSF